MAELVKILIVEDCEEDREFCRRGLLKTFDGPCCLLYAKDGAEALELVGEHGPNLIILEHQLPDMDGLELLNALKDVLPGGILPPVIMLARQACERVAVAAMKQGVSDYFVKAKTTPEQLSHAAFLALKQAKLTKILAASEQRFHASVESMLDCFGIYVAVRNEAGQIIGFRAEYLNTAAADRHSIKLHSEGDAFRTLGPSDWTETLFQNYCDLVETGNALSEEIIIYKAGSAEPPAAERAYDIRASKLEDGFVAIWRETTQRKSAELTHLALIRRAEEARLEAEAANQAKDEFVAMVSHDLRTPLNAIVGWAQILQRRPDPQNISRAIEAIQRSTQQQLSLINSLLDMSRILNGSLELNLQPIDALDICRMALLTAHPQIQERGLTLDCSLDDRRTSITDRTLLLSSIHQHQPLLIIGDATRISQVLGNLLDNAVKFTPQGGHICFAIQVDHGVVEISIQDSGQGISPELLPQVFERFRQGNTAQKSKGLGLGLAIAHQLVKDHGGELEAMSDGLGHGACFTVRLPLHQSCVVQPIPRATPESTDHTATNGDWDLPSGTSSNFQLELS